MNMLILNILKTCVAHLTFNLLTDNTNEHSFYRKYAVNTESAWASRIGKEILEKGGNALDAAIASALAVGVVNSFSSGIGGGGFMMIRQKSNISGEKDNFHFFDFREVAPKNITADMFKHNPNSSKTTGLAVCVPGEILGFYEAHKRYGKLPWNSLFTHSIKLAKRFRATKKLAEKLNKNKSEIMKDPGLREIFTKEGRLIKEGEIVHRLNYANTLEMLSKDPLAFYEGELGDKIVEFIRKNGGVMTKTDLEEYKVVGRPILTSTFYDYTVVTTNLPTSGLFIIQALKLLEKINIRDLKYFINEQNRYRLYHILIEMFKFLFADRVKLGDPDFLDDWDTLVDNVISEAHIKEIFEKFDASKPLNKEKYGNLTMFKEDHGTTHLNVIDSDEMIVQITSSINLEFGSKLLDPITGIIFNNTIDDFYIPGIDNFYKLEEMKENIISGMKRPFSSASPTLLIKNDEILAIGAAGGTRIPTSIVSTIVYLLIGNTLEEAITQYRIHNQLSPSKTFIEANFPKHIIRDLVRLGHHIERSESNTHFTSVQAIQLLKSNFKKKIYAVSDFRKMGMSFGM